MKRTPLPPNLAQALALLEKESDRVDLALAARRDGFDRPAYTCERGPTDGLIAQARHAFDLSYNLRTSDTK